MRNVLAATLAAGWMVLAGSVAAAETPDLVKLKNGGMVRGTIDEFVPGDHVRITMANGESRTFPAAEVEFAGPSNAAAPTAPSGAEAHFEVAPSAPVPATSPPPQQNPQVQGVATAGMIPLRFKYTGELQPMFHVRSGMQQGTFSGVSWGARGGIGSYGGVVQSDSYLQLCTAPCEAELAKGSYKLALTEGDGRPVAADGLVTIDQPSTLTGEYTSYSGLRAAGLVTLIAGAAVMVAAPFVAVNDCDTLDSSCERLNTTTFLVMLTGGGVAAIVGGIMALKSDEARVSVTPGLSQARRKAPPSGLLQF